MESVDGEGDGEEDGVSAGGAGGAGVAEVWSSVKVAMMGSGGTSGVIAAVGNEGGDGMWEVRERSCPLYGVSGATRNKSDGWKLDFVLVVLIWKSNATETILQEMAILTLAIGVDFAYSKKSLNFAYTMTLSIRGVNRHKYLSVIATLHWGSVCRALRGRQKKKKHQKESDQVR